MRATRAVLAVVGLAAMVYAVVGATNDDGVNIVGVVAFLAVVLIGHDMIVLPLAIGIGVLVVRYVPSWARAWVQCGLLASVAVTFVATPLLVAAGRLADNPSRLPLDYPRGLLTVLALIWLVVAVGSLTARRRTRSRRDAP